MRFPICRSLPSPRRIRVESSRRDGAVKGLCYSGRLSAAVEVMCARGSPADEQTYKLLLQESVHWKEYRLGRRIHAQMISTGFTPDEYLKTKLLILYAKDGDLAAAHKLFDEMPKRSVIPWNAMLSGYVQNGLEAEGLDFFFLMVASGMSPDQFSFASAFRACARRATLECGRRVHAIMVKTLVIANVVVSSALVDMYFKCSAPDDGRRAFENSPERNIVTWTVLISGYGVHGCAAEVIELFRRMVDEGFRPNHITFVAVLSACGRRGLVGEAWGYFNSMAREYNIRPRGEHYAAMVDLLGRSGRLEEAYELVKKGPSEQHPVMWGALLGACKVHGDAGLVKIAAERFFDLMPENTGKYVVLSNFCAGLGRWQEVVGIRGLVRTLGRKKDPGQSSVEIRGKVHTFLAGDQLHEEIDSIEEVIRTLGALSGEEGIGVISL